MGLLCLLLLLFALPLLPELLGPALLLGFVLLPLLFVPLFCASASSSVSSGLSAGGAGGFWMFGFAFCRAWVMDWTVVVGANGERGADTLAVNDDGEFGCFARRYLLDVGVDLATA